MPQTEALQDRFRAAHTQVLGVSVDSVFSHAAWGASLGGVSFPLLADFHPKGELARALGLFLEEAGISDRATVIIDSAGVVQFVEALGPPGQRDIDKLLAQCEEIDAKGTAAVDALQPADIGRATLYIRSNCGPSRFASWACTNLHLDSIEIKNVSEDSAAAGALKSASGGSTAPCLVVGDRATSGHEAIIAKMVAAAAPLHGQ